MITLIRAKVESYTIYIFIFVGRQLLKSKFDNNLETKYEYVLRTTF